MSQRTARQAPQRLPAGSSHAPAIDIEEEIQEELRRERERRQSLIDSVDGIVWEVDVATFRFTFVSEQALRLLGYPIEAWYGEGFWTSILHPEDRDAALSFCISRTRRMEAHDFEYRVLASDGRVVWLRDIVTVVAAEGRPVALRGIMVDITAQKQFQAERERLLESERAARQAAEALARANAALYSEAQEAIRLRDDFLSVASHELYTPLTSLLLLVEGLTSGRVPRSQESLSRALPLIDRQVHRLIRLATDLLDVARIQGDRLSLHLEPVDLVVVVEEAVSLLALELARAGSALTIRGKPHVTGLWDRPRLEQIAVNLLTNAVKFGRGAPIDILVDAQDDVARLVVRDHGIGIAEERLPHIFGRFERAVSPREFGGFGLGLYITRTVVEALGGTIRAEAAPGQGATFIVTLPRAHPGGS